MDDKFYIQRRQVASVEELHISVIQKQHITIQIYFSALFL